MKIITCTILICLVFCCTSNSQSQKELEPEAINAKFFNILRSNSNSGLDYIFATNRWLNKPEIDSAKERLNSLIVQVGSYQGEELVTTKSIGKSYILYFYFVRYERQPVRFLLTYYKAKDQWQLQNFQFDLDFESELKEATSAHRLIENLDLDQKK
jgi:hypothetical protein